MQNSFNCVMFEGCLACTGHFKSPYSISIGLRFRLWFVHFRIHNIFPLSHFLVELLKCFWSLSCCMVNICFSFNFLTWYNIFLQESSGKIKNSWWIMWWWAGQALLEQDRPKPWHFHFHNWGMRFLCSDTVFGLH